MAQLLPAAPASSWSRDVQGSRQKKSGRKGTELPQPLPSEVLLPCRVMLEQSIFSQHLE